MVRRGLGLEEGSGGVDEGGEGAGHVGEGGGEGEGTLLGEAGGSGRGQVVDHDLTRKTRLLLGGNGDGMKEGWGNDSGEIK